MAPSHSRARTRPSQRSADRASPGASVCCPANSAFLRERGLKLVSDLDANEYREKVMGTAGRRMQGYGFYHTVLAEVSDA